MKMLVPALKKYLILLVIILICAALKLLADYGSAKDLDWMLWPLAKTVSLFTGIPFAFDPDLGYVSPTGALILGTTCSGINYMIILLLLSGFSFLQNISPRSQIIKTLLFVPASWCVSLFVNASRIAISVSLLKYADRFPAITTDKVHEAIGILYFLSFLLIYYFLLRHRFGKIKQHEPAS
jgi:exosortase K